MAVGVRLWAALAVAALLCATAAAQLPDDEFSFLGIPRSAASGGFMPMPVGGLLGMGKLLDSFAQGDAEPAGKPTVRVIRLHRLPPMLSSLIPGFGGTEPQKSETPRSRPTVIPMNFPHFGSSALNKLRGLANNCVPCGRVQSHMRSISIMHGPNGQQVKTVTETGPDGEEHTTRTVTQTDEGADLMDAIMAPLEGVESVVKDVESVVKDTPNTLPTVAKEINKEEAKAAVQKSVDAQGMDLETPEKRQQLASHIADKLGVSPDSVKVSVSGEDGDGDADSEVTGENDEATPVEDTDEDEESVFDDNDEPADPDVDDESEDDENSSDADELEQEFADEEEEKKAVLEKEQATIAKVSVAADAAKDEADKKMEVADHLKAIEAKMQHSAGVIA
jgi:hypothetical protein